MNNIYGPDEHGKPLDEEDLTAAEIEAGEKSLGCFLVFLGGAALTVYGIYAIVTNNI